MIIASNQCLGKLFDHIISLEICKKIARDVSGRCFIKFLGDFILAISCVFSFVF